MIASPLPRIRFHSNWSPSSSSRRDYLIRDFGERLDEVAETIVSELGDKLKSDVELGLAKERSHRIDCVPLRVLHAISPLHKSCVDVTITRRASDLFLRTHVTANTWLRYLRVLFVTLITWLLVVLGVWVYLSYTDAFGAIVDDSVRQRSPGVAEPTIAARAGYYLDPETQHWVVAQTKSLPQILLGNPRLAFSHLAGPILLIVSCAGAIAFCSMRLFFDSLCALIGWPTPATMDDFAAANEAWVIGVLTRTFLEHFGIGEECRIRT